MDVHCPHLENSKYWDRHVIPIHADAVKLSELFAKPIRALFNKSLEHFSKEERYRLLRMAEEIAYYRVAVFTPRGYFPQTNYDFFKMGGEAFQEHRSGWECGYHVKVLNAKNPSFAAFGPDPPLVDAILAWKEMYLNRMNARFCCSPEPMKGWGHKQKRELDGKGEKWL